MPINITSINVKTSYWDKTKTQRVSDVFYLLSCEKLSKFMTSNDGSGIAQSFDQMAFQSWNSNSIDVLNKFFK